MLSERNKEQPYLGGGFNSWKKAPKCFKNHQQRNFHKAAAALETVVTKYGSVAMLTIQSIVESMRKGIFGKFVKDDLYCIIAYIF